MCISKPYIIRVTKKAHLSLEDTFRVCIVSKMRHDIPSIGNLVPTYFSEWRPSSLHSKMKTNILYLEDLIRGFLSTFLDSCCSLSLTIRSYTISWIALVCACIIILYALCVHTLTHKRHPHILYTQTFLRLSSLTNPY